MPIFRYADILLYRNVFISQYRNVKISLYRNTIVPRSNAERDRSAGQTWYAAAREIRPAKTI